MTLPGPRTIVCDVSALDPDALTIDALARLQLSSRRVGLELRLRHASNELQELLAFVGLDEVLRLEAGRQPEQREQRVGVEEERELDEPSA
jgi:anti-anti-sigma regulatory factor